MKKSNIYSMALDECNNQKKSKPKVAEFPNMRVSPLEKMIKTAIFGIAIGFCIVVAVVSAVIFFMSM